MRVAVVNLTSGGLSGGYVKYLKSMLPLMTQDSRVTGLKAYYPPSASIPDVRDCESVQWSGDMDSMVDVVLRAKPDVVFIPTARWARFGTTPTAVMVRNMEPLEVPFGGNSLSECVRNLARRHTARAACRRATGVVAVSDHVRQFLERRWAIPADRIAMIYHGVGSHTGEQEQPPAEAAQLADGVFLFAAGSIRPARGLEDLVVALPAIARQNPAVRLGIAGGVDRGAEGYHRRLVELAARLDVARNIVWLGSLGPEEMAWCYRRCTLFVMTSRAEACPNTLLEAMSHGCRIVSGDNPPMPEFLQAAATFYRARDAGSLAPQLTNALSDESDRGLRDAARRRAAEFRWDLTAEETMGFLQLVARRGIAA